MTPDATSAVRRVAFLVAGSRGAAFYSQIAALVLALQALNWQRWTPAFYAYLGPITDQAEQDSWPRWAPYLQHVRIVDVPPEVYAEKGNWAQVDATLQDAPLDADVLVSLDADTFPVARFEDVLDRVADDGSIAGVMGHYPPSPGLAAQAEWERVANGRIGRPLVFDHAYSLVDPDETPDRRRAPFYVNGGVVFYARATVPFFVPRYLELRARLEGAVDEAFTGQVAAALAVADTQLPTWELPLRYNFPNDPVAERLHPIEAAHVVIHHYLRTARYDRHRIFATPEEFDRFLALPLDGADLTFQRAVRKVFGSRYPF